MITEFKKEKYLEVSRQAARWYMRNQNSDANPWGGIKNSADEGRFIYEFFPALKSGRGAGVWAQGLGIMALHSLNIKTGGEYESGMRDKCSLLAGKYLLSLQYKDKCDKENYGGFGEHVPCDYFSYPRDAATGGMGLCALYRITKDDKYLNAAKIFADWYRIYASDKGQWPYCTFNFEKRKGYDNENEAYLEAQGHNKFVRGDWQAGGALFYYYLASISGERKYIDEYMMPVVKQLVKLYEENPVDKVIYGFHGKTPVSFGNDDFALVTLIAAAHATGNKEYYKMAKDRIIGLLNIMDAENGRFPSYAGTFTMAITMKVLKDMEEYLGNKPDPRLQEAIELVAENGLELQAYDYNEPRVNGGFWGQSNFEIARDRIHHRSTGYAAIFYAMITEGPLSPYYHCLDWNIPAK